VICLEGLTVLRKYESSNGFAISISHRDGIYEEKKVYFKNEKLLLDWMELLKFYKGASVHELYEIREKIGTGKFSLVYRCKNLAEGQWYALK
jgi:serine/threonine protein kinase